MKGVKRWLSIWLNRLYKTLAVLLVLFAVLFSAARIFLPYAHTYKASLERYANELYEGEIAIGELSAGWKNFGPALVIRDVNVSQDSALDLHIEQIDVSLDIINSIRLRSLIASNFNLDGAQLQVNPQQLVAKKPAQANTDIQTILDLFLQKTSRFTVENSQFIVDKGEQQHTFEISKMAWLNEGREHRGVGDIHLQGFTDNSAKLLIKLRSGTDKGLAGNMYLQASNLDITPFLDSFLGERGSELDSNINFQSWFELAHGQISAMRLVFGENTLQWQHPKTPMTMTLNQGQIDWQRLGTGTSFRLRTSDLVLNVDEQPFDPVQVLMLQQQGVQHTYIPHLSVLQWSQLLPLTEGLFEQYELVQALQLKGDIEQIHLQTRPNYQLASLKAQDVSWKNAGSIPGIENFHGAVSRVNERWFASVTSSDSELNFGGHFARPIPITEFSADAEFVMAEDRWQLQANTLQLRSDEIDLQGKMTLGNLAQPELGMNLAVKVNSGDVSRAKYYLPLQVTSAPLVNYLNQAIYYGNLSDASVLFNGAFKDFPFTDNSGVFVVDADIQQSKYQFHQDWPAIENLTANLNFTNNSMLITALDGELAGIKTHDVQVAIPQLKSEASMLTVRTPVTASGQQLTELMEQSPLSGSVGETLSFINPRGHVSGHFSLDLPLTDTSKAVAKGDISFSDLQAKLNAPDMDFRNIRGRLSFENSAIKAQQLQLDWRDLPMTLDVDGRIEDNFYQVDIGLAGNWQAEHYQKEIPQALQQYLNGPLNWQGDLSLFMPEQGQFSYKLNISSDLQQADLRLPQPYRKRVGTSLPLTAKASGRVTNSNIELQVGDELNFFGELLHEQVRFKRAHLILGREKMFLPLEGFHITTDLQQIELQPWYALVNDILTSIPDGSGDTTAPSFIQAPERIRGNIGKLSLFRQTLNDVSFNLVDKESWWLLQLNSDEARSRVRFHHDFARQGLEIDADFIHLLENTPETEEQLQREIAVLEEAVSEISLLPADLPKILFKCSSCQYQNLDLGQVNFSLNKGGTNVATLESFTAQRKGFRVDLSGQWLVNDESNITNIDGKVSANDLGAEMKRLGFGSEIRDSGIDSSFSFNWQGGPQNFSVENLNGKIGARLDDGYLADVDDKGARLLAIFSIQSLVRKLALDFRDVFSKGMFYNEIKGDFVLSDGVIFTDNLRMDGVAGNVSIRGNTNLLNESLDYRMSFAPKITSSIPIILAFAINPAAGFGAMVVDEVLQKSEVISVINFELTGTIEEPVFKEVERKSRRLKVEKQPVDGAASSPKISSKSESNPAEDKRQLTEQPHQGDGG
ncbi:YhdP family protein [Thalassotalea mangrovi]|uniref:TIGR02099 family protein n=1 Tax=Thalassotalea mangrovi TaxID=2572245 RepID=A0A4V5NUU8_9GAMM|nr:YhdP family protein [Thalassotalea mangrovi]TKB47878.1 TIGR02099 family protein [Thalassotalea mangrovi]